MAWKQGDGGVHHTSSRQLGGKLDATLRKQVQLQSCYGSPCIQLFLPSSSACSCLLSIPLKMCSAGRCPFTHNLHVHAVCTELQQHTLGQYEHPYPTYDETDSLKLRSTEDA